MFRVEARNLYGFSAYSDTVMILAAAVPVQPLPPTTTWNPDDVVITWVAPNDGGSPLNGYTVKLR